MARVRGGDGLWQKLALRDGNIIVKLFPRSFVITLALFLSLISSVHNFQTLAPTTSGSSIVNVTSPNRSETATTTTIRDYEDQETSLNNRNQNETKTTPAPTEATTTLLSSEEFVDFTEVPTLLFDGTANDDANTTIANNTMKMTSTDKNETSSQNSVSATGFTATLAPEVATTQSLLLPTIQTVAKATETTTPVSGAAGGTTSGYEHDQASNDEDSSNGNTSSGHSIASNDTDTATPPAGELEAEFETPQNISQYMDYIEKLFRDLRHQITDLFEPHLPQLIRTSQSVELSSSCSFDMLRMAFALRQFEPWALKMIDSSGKVPEGIFEGSFTALGSYDECLSVVFESDNSAASDSSSQSPSAGDDGKENSSPTQGKYCLVTVSPFLPPKPPTDRVERMFQEEANKRNYTKDDQFSRLSPMFYYMKFRIGVCIPSTCDQGDVDSIASALSTNLRLNITIPDCRVKQTDAPLTRHQFVSGLVIICVFAMVVGATVLDSLRQKCQQIKRQEMQIMRVNNESREAPTTNNDLIIKMNHSRDDYHLDAINRILEQKDQFLNRLYKHWSWMSFSLLTNFRLYFRTEGELSSIKIHEDEQKSSRPNNHMIKCLNGIRVLSLCWVIIANSYLTLDPRATKRLTKTREAPKDFLFQIVVQASLAIETFFFLSGLLMSLSFSRRFDSLVAENLKENNKIEGKKTSWLQWANFYVHRYVRMTPATMLVIALTMYAYPYGDGPIWFEATKNSHDSCKRNWWRHMLHIANYIDTRQMCFIHYWYISADMQLFLFAPILLFLVRKYKYLGYSLIGLIGSSSIFTVFYTTYERNLPPTLLFYSSDPESRREFGNTIMTKPLTHVLPYIVGMLVGQWLASTTKPIDTTYGDKNFFSPRQAGEKHKRPIANRNHHGRNYIHSNAGAGKFNKFNKFFASFAIVVALAEVFLPYKWNNSHLPTRLMASIYASLFRLGWSLVLAYVVISCAHAPGSKCHKSSSSHNYDGRCKSCRCSAEQSRKSQQVDGLDGFGLERQQRASYNCFCSSGGNLVNQLLSLKIFTHLSKLSFVAYLIHLPMMSVFIGQTRGLFAFSHTLVIHLAISYLVLTFVLSFALVHLIEFPFITFERLLFDRWFHRWRYGSKSFAKTEDKHEFSFAGIISPQSKCYNLATHQQRNPPIDVMAPQRVDAVAGNEVQSHRL